MEITARNIPLDEDYEFEEMYYESEEPVDEELTNDEMWGKKLEGEKPRRKGLCVKRRRSMRQEKKLFFAKKAEKNDEGKAKKKKNDEDKTTPEYKLHRWTRGHHNILFEE